MLGRKLSITALCLGAILVSGVAFAADAPTSPQPGRLFTPLEVVLLALAGALVWFMQAGFALLESGFSRAKNAVNVLMKNYLDMCFGAAAFWAIGYGLMFGFNPTGFLGVSHFFLGGATQSDYVFLFYQMMFAATAATIVSGAIAERTHFQAYIIGSIIITGLIYPVYGSWAWGAWHGGQGWLAKLGFIDFAGSTVVHSVGGWCALAALIIIKPRLGRYAADGTPRLIPGHNLSAATTGALILWLGWFGFNGGSVAPVPNGIENLLGKVVLNTHLGGTAGAVGSMLAMWVFRNKSLLSVTLNGGVAGLVSVTAGCAVMEPGFALLTGLVAGFLVSVAESVLVMYKIDDVVGAVPVHLVGGIWGTLAAGLFKADALLNLTQIKVQLIGIAVAGAWVFPTALLMYWVLHKTVGLRASDLSQQRGLDFSEHAEVGYPEFQQEVVHGGQQR